MYRRGVSSGPVIIIGIVILVVVIIFFLYLSPSQQAKRAVDQFYRYEQEAKFSSSWEMFHPLMKERFSRSNYMQDRNHVFMNHFGVDTFEFSLSRAKRVNGWRMSEDSEAIPGVYRVTVTKYYGGKYGRFQFVQDTFASREEDGWKIMWDYRSGD
ncbi:hypothetical protein ACERII_16440 [Evansella sp. AB-rgal1]|uniref:hypothetical protein n=1 Tax=Evansella sp. AB-rgal1 TaxID=3242696 RepID=UPI00359E3555